MNINKLLTDLDEVIENIEEGMYCSATDKIEDMQRELRIVIQNNTNPLLKKKVEEGIKKAQNR